MDQRTVMLAAVMEPSDAVLPVTATVSPTRSPPRRYGFVTVVELVIFTSCLILPRSVTVTVESCTALTVPTTASRAEPLAEVDDVGLPGCS